MSRGSVARRRQTLGRWAIGWAIGPDLRSSVAGRVLCAVVLLAVVAVAAGVGTRGWRSWFGERRRLVETIDRLVADASPESRILLSACGGALLDVVDRHPDGVDTVIALARFYQRFGAPADAVRCWNRCRELEPRAAARCHEAVADIALEEGRFAAAAESYGQAVAADPAREQPAIHQAESLLGDGRPREAVAVLRDTVRRHGRSVAACSLLGQALLQLGEVAAAREQLEAAVQLGPDYPAARHALSTACARLGDDAAAAEHRQAFAELQKRKETRHREELRTKDDTASLRDTLATTLTDAARVYFAHGDESRGENCLAVAIATSPREPECRLLLAQLRETQRRPGEAAAAYLDSARVAGNDAGRLLAIASSLERLGRVDEAETLHARVIELLPDRPTGYAALADMLLRTGRDPARARGLAREAVDREPAAGYWRLLERACRTVGDTEAAAEAAQAATTARGRPGGE